MSRAGRVRYTPELLARLLKVPAGCEVDLGFSRIVLDDSLGTLELCLRGRNMPECGEGEEIRVVYNEDGVILL